MSVDHEVRWTNPLTGEVTRIPLDSSNPEHRRLIDDRVRAGGTDIFRLGERARQDLARSQYVQAQRERYEQEGIAGSQVLAQTAGAAMGMADELSLGMDRRIARALGLTDQQDAQLDAIQQATDESYMAGRIGAAVIPALLTGGESLAARGGVATASRFTPQGFSAALGNSIANRFERMVAARGLGPGMSRFAGRTVGTVADGAISGAMNAVAEANIHDEELTGERFLAGAGVGGVLGLAALPFGAIEGGVVALENRAAREAAERLQESGLVRIMGEGDVPRVGDLGALQPEARPSVIARMLGLNPAFQIPEAQRGLARLADPDGWSRAIDQPGFQQHLVTTAETFNRALQEVRESGASVLNAEARQAALRAAAAGADADAAAGREALRVGSAQIRSGLSPTSMRPAARARVESALDELDRILDTGGDDIARLDRFLEDLPTTGDEVADGVLSQIRARVGAAGDQYAPGFQTIRHARDEYEAITRDMRRFGSGSESAGFRFAPQAMGAQFGHSARGTRKANIGMFAEWLERSERVLGLSAGDTSQALDALRQANASAREAIDWGDLVGSLDFIRTLESGTSGAQAAVGNKLGFLAAGALGWAAGGPLTAALGIGMAAFGHPTGFLAGVNGLKRMVGLSEARVAQSVGRLGRSLRNPRLERGLGHAALGGRQVPRVVQRLRNPRERQEQYDEIVERVRAYASDPQALAARLEILTEHIAGNFPASSGGFANSAASALYHLADNLPPAELPSPFPGKRRRPSVSEMEDLIRRYEALEDPVSIIDRAADGSLSAAHVDAVRAAYPRLYAALSAEVTGLLGDLEELPPYQVRVRLGTLLGIRADATLDPRFLWAAQQTYAQTTGQNEAQLGRGSSATMSMRVSDDTMTRAASVTHRL